MFALDLLDPSALLEQAGMVGLVAIVFAETGILAGFFLPGDSLLFTAGLLAAQNRFGFEIGWIVPGCIMAAVLGDQLGYHIGRGLGPALFERPDARFFRKKHLERATSYFDEHGNRTIVLARFVPIVRTFAPVLAGAAAMPRRRFATYNVLGGVLWGGGVSVAGYFLGETIPSIDRYLLPAVALIVVVSIVPMLREVRRERGRRSEDSLA